MKARITFILTIISCTICAYAQEVTNIHKRDWTISFISNEIDSITFSNYDIHETAQYKIDAYTYFVNQLKEAKENKDFIYCDFAQFADTPKIQKIKSQSGPILTTNGNGSKTTSIKDGKTHNSDNYYIFNDMDAPVKYIGMKYSYEVVCDKTEENDNGYPPCVILLGQTKDPWTYIIHILFYNDKLYINTRHGEGFVDDCVLVEGTTRFEPRGFGETYEVSVYIVDNKLYIKKPDGKYVVFQNEYFREDFHRACWQSFITQKFYINGCLNELYAGDKPGLEEAYRTINTIKNW